MPGTYRYRANRKAPLQAVRIVYDGVGSWYCLVNGEVVGTATDPEAIKFIMWHGPFHKIPEADYQAILSDYITAKQGSPLTKPTESVNLRRSSPL